MCVARTDVGCRRKLNEDAVLCAPGIDLWAVADGMGGHEAGEVASAMIVERLGHAGRAQDLMARTHEARQAVQAVNAELMLMGGERTIGSTVVLLTADERAFSCLWAGDSRAYLARAGALRQLTRDHSLVQELVDAGELSPEDAAAHPNANVIRRAVGAAPRLDLDFVHGDLAGGDTFLLASDGLTRLVNDEEILAGLADPDLAHAADAFIETSLARGAPDNVSIVLIRHLVAQGARTSHGG
jgi:serine/threonine protein phosphatase PrpC